MDGRDTLYSYHPLKVETKKASNWAKYVSASLSHVNRPLRVLRALKLHYPKLIDK